MTATSDDKGGNIMSSRYAPLSSNAKRANRGMAAIERHPAYNADAVETYAVDMIADILHACARAGVGAAPSELVARALDTFAGDAEDDEDATDSSALDVDPWFDSWHQEVRTPGERVYLVDDTIAVGEGAEGTYVGLWHKLAVVDFDTPSGEPFRVAVQTQAIKALYR